MHSPYVPAPKNQYRRTGHVFSCFDLIWRGNMLRAGRLKLAGIKPDAEWSGMWRVVIPATAATPDGRITDMVNLSRARDAAMALALTALNKNHAEETGVGAPLVRLNGGGYG